MKVLVDVSFDRVDDWWSGGRDTMEDVIAWDKCAELERLAEEQFGCLADEGRYPEDGEVNDWLWFERDDIYRALGIYGKVYGDDDEDSEEDDDDEDSEEDDDE